MTTTSVLFALWLHEFTHWHENNSTHKSKLKRKQNCFLYWWSSLNSSYSTHENMFNYEYQHDMEKEQGSEERGTKHECSS